MTYRGGLFAAVTVLSLSGCSMTETVDPVNESEPCSGELPLGQPCLEETRTTLEVTPGVTYTRIERGERSKDDAYTVDVAFKAEASEAESIANELKADGYEPWIETIPQRPPDDPGSGPLGYLVRLGPFAIDAEAFQVRERLVEDAYPDVRVVYTGEDGGVTTGPWVLHVLEVDPQLYKGTIAPELGSGVVPEREILSSISKRVGSLAAINAGYFVIESENGTPGDLAGISVLDGALVSEAVDGRTSLILPTRSGEGAWIAALSDTLTVTSSDGATSPVDGLNRKPGLIRSCGGEGDTPTEGPKHDFTCTDESEIIVFTPHFGAATEPGEGVEAALDASGVVLELRENLGGTIPSGGSVVSGTGEGADWLLAHAPSGATLHVATEVSADGTALPLTAGMGIVNGGPRLLRDGNPDITAYAEGFSWPEDPGFYYRFGVRRNPRTFAGITPKGTLLLVVVDGRQAGYSVGASFEESALIMQALGAQEAINLDGGGSSTMTLGADRVNHTSDATGERPLGDALVLLP